jgi:hypothetical protein
MNFPEEPSVATPEECRESVGQTDVEPAKLQPRRSIQWAQTLILIALYVVPALLCLRLAAVSDTDLGFHLRTGEWMFENRAVPQMNLCLFSIPGAGKSWASYSWLYELLIFQLNQRLGLVGVMIYATGMVVLIAVALQRLVCHLQTDFTLAALQTLLATYCITRLYTPRPWMFSVLFFILQVDLLMQARKTGRPQRLLWLPVIYALWSNLHIQFIDGLVVLAIASAETLIALRWSGVQSRIRASWMCGISVACVLAVMANPYGWKIYQFAYDLAAQPGVLKYVSEFQPLPFRGSDDWGVLLLALGATAVLAWGRSFAFFESMLLVFATYVSFRSQRDLWVLVIAASAILAGRLKGDEKNRFQLPRFAAPLIAFGTGFAIWIGFLALHVDQAHLSKKLAENLPVHAVEVVKEKGWSGPLYNDFNWGGYLIWALRMPVGIDGRAALYGDERIDHSISTWSGQRDWNSDPDLAKAGLVIGPVNMPLTQLLRMDPRFQLTYEDKLAAVFVARKNLSSAAAATPAAVGGVAHDPVK